MTLDMLGGHPGLEVVRIDTGLEQSVIRKTALHDTASFGELAGVDLYGLNETAIHNEAFMLDVMDGSGYTPKLFDIKGGQLWQEDIGNTETPRDPEHWRHNLVRMLATIRARGLRHGDLKGGNIITRDDHPYAIDWQEGHCLGDVPPQVRPKSDSYFLMQHIEATPDENGYCDIPRVARRWRAVLESLGAVEDVTLPLKGKTFLDVGCFQGDFVALAAAEGMFGYGFDTSHFRSGENSIDIGLDIWRGFPFGRVRLLQRDVHDATTYSFGFNVVMMFSTWPYIVREYGYEFGIDLLRRIVDQAGVFFFETQYAGDGPGVAAVKDSKDVYKLFTDIGAGTVEPIAAFPVTHKPFERTIWRIEK